MNYNEQEIERRKSLKEMIDMGLDPYPSWEVLLHVKAKYLVLVYGIYELWSELNRMPGDNVAHLAHLSGMLIAYIILRYWKKKYGTYY